MKREELKNLIPYITEEQLTKLEKDEKAVYEKGKADAENAYRKKEFERELNQALIKAAAKNVKALKALLDISKITFENGELCGLSEQIDKLKKENGFLFEEGGNKPEFTAPNSGTQKMTAKEFENLSYKKRLKLFMENPELYKQLSR